MSERQSAKHTVERCVLYAGSTCKASPGDLFCSSPHSKGAQETKVCPRTPSIPISADAVHGTNASSAVGSCGAVDGFAERPPFEASLGGVTR